MDKLLTFNSIMVCAVISFSHTNFIRRSFAQNYSMSLCRMLQKANTDQWSLITRGELVTIIWERWELNTIQMTTITFNTDYTPNEQEHTESIRGLHTGTMSGPYQAFQWFLLLWHDHSQLMMFEAMTGWGGFAFALIFFMLSIEK